MYSSFERGLGGLVETDDRPLVGVSESKEGCVRIDGGGSSDHGEHGDIGITVGVTEARGEGVGYKSCEAPHHSHAIEATIG